MRRFLLGAVAALVLAGCGGGGGGGPSPEPAAAERTARTDPYGNPIAAGEDWSGAGRVEEGSAERPSGSGVPEEAGEASGGAAGGGVVCTTPTTTPEQGSFEPAPDNAFGTPDNDFVVTVTVDPREAEAGDAITVEVVAPGQADALAVFLARFSDGESHGMRAAKFTDAAGRATFTGPIPASAPQGLAVFTVSVSYPDNRSAITRTDFTVNGPDCPPQS